MSIDLRPARRSPHRSDSPPSFGCAAFGLDITGCVQDHPTRFNFGHRFLFHVGAGPATDLFASLCPPHTVRRWSAGRLALALLNNDSGARSAPFSQTIV